MSLLGRLAGKKGGTDARQAPAISPAFPDAQKRLLSRLADMVTQDSEEGGGRLSGDALKTRVLSVLDDMLREVTTLTPTEQELLRGSVMYEVFGFGPIQPFLDDDNVSEIMVNGPDRVFIERKGKIELSDVTFVDDEHVKRIIEKIVAPIGRRIDESSPMVDARLPDGSRVNAIIPPRFHRRTIHHDPEVPQGALLFHGSHRFRNVVGRGGFLSAKRGRGAL